ncbi:TPA: conjugal transfer protein TrbH [Legionella pneumophila]|uniref:Conjugal transfer protein TrbH n=1 Tax=Legionella pneumophila subsp. pneumophila TaxID=91891 RepID=A0AAV2UZA3_LEGPN|nr:conjugal transfer protein TrbH [Legionella pneumophila]AMQ28654.1 conjugal transfer protein TrbH [Legionella pneumophila subsp. pneumophila]ANN93354.1 conjugal transfer protein TrbH [Legionella pneumophila]MCH9063178.1 conjugal transfer protein TrbH [Legionella pneumophila serogroup 1]MCH9091254.1 conjugal transfer protein TrbH [Legionella pneumophila serogroup 1]MCH9132800.1 conjugal transfer protein TrbH [Legionella pneumophila serogroup 1]
MKKLSVLLLAVLLSSCASHRYGNFTQLSQGRDAYLAADAVNQLTRVYPPAQNSFCIGQRVRDGFGLNLIQGLRKKGYGVNENQCPKHKANLYYVVDELEPLYRVSLFLGTQTLSRVYTNNHDKIFPVSAWTHKE